MKAVLRKDGEVVSRLEDSDCGVLALQCVAAVSRHLGRPLAPVTCQRALWLILRYLAGESTEVPTLSAVSSADYGLIRFTVEVEA